MKLKELEIKGFKSFADKTKVIFDNQITGIVGPNGCGKSNIVDAIRWVIGEHKISALRSENLDGLVFNGSKTRPSSAMAEVSLTFDNDKNILPTDYSTVTVSRKFYKNGDSEYKLNDVSCRLKDINNLFLDTGISSDSYAIIELGMVDDIIKDKDNARRRMLEQAAGISIYKTRKKEAQQKLKSTEIDLSRIDDLLFEIKGNLKTLENQAKKAEKYKQFKSEYKDLSIKHARKSLTTFNEDFQKLNRSILDFSDKKFQLENNINAENTSLDELKTNLNEKEQHLNGLQKSYAELLQEISKLEQDKQLNIQKRNFQEEKLSSLQSLISSASEQLTELSSALKMLEEQAIEEKQDFDNLSKNADTFKEELTQNQSAYNAAKEALELLKKQVNEKQNQKYQIEKEHAILESSIHNLKNSLTQESEEENKRQEQIKSFESQKNELEITIEKDDEALKNLIEQQETLKNQVLEQQQILENIRASLAEENRFLDAKKNEYDLLKSMVDNLEGYPESIKYLSKNKSWNERPTLLSDIILPKNEYKTAIENLLSQYLNYFVVNDIEEAKKAISILSQDKKGKASFIILNQIPQTTHTPYTQGIAALEVVEYDAQYKNLMQMLLGNVYIVNTENDIPENSTHTFIDAKGAFLLNKWNATGGSVGIFEGNKIGRAKNLEKIADEIKQKQSLVSDIKLNFENTQETINNTKEGLSEKKVNDLKQDLNRLQQELFNVSNKLENIQKQSELGSQKKQDWQKQLDEMSEKINTFSAQNKDLLNESDELTKQLVQNELELENKEQNFRKSSDQWNVYSVQLSSFEQKYKSTQDKINLRNQQQESLQKQLEDNQKNITETRHNNEDTSQAINTISEQIEKQLFVKNEKKDHLDKLDQEYHVFKNTLNEKESALNKSRREKEMNDTLLLESKEKMSAMKLEVSTLNERMKIEFDINLDSILNEEVQIDENLEDLASDLEKIKSKISSLGDVNPTAIEAYNEIKERYTFISEQKNDLEKAKDNLLQTINEVEKTANEKFAETFEKVRENFINVFQALFTEEDTCDMKMTDPDNISETGIEIYARPKGKKPAAITQLSGGEKTLTSTALLFAIYLIKPAPFCILDEVDAPLDDANVEKFTQMIRKFSDNSQFIIVTHNKQTMASVDAIYGVTMQEPGVSKLVPVDFRSLN